ncbi:PVC-type heme-binding CxxCH protein [Schlesneria paludicola]|uniref:PVC-type heme-binding CxxCH protein n=1 Tax=Schlesneria paludicola TaxID=360056 RepID=UPI00029A8849|nr:PVC-type heme-binding CxxCH protein [Schlesneria paludicola]
MPCSPVRLIPSCRTFVLLGLLFASRTVLSDEIGVRVPEGFEVTEFASDDLAHNIFSMTVDSKGRVVVAGAGYVKILIDSDGDGKADRAQLFSEFPKSGAQGMYFNGRSLVCVGDGAILRLKDANGDDVADGPPETFLKLRAGGEHDGHSIQQGPDGWWYVIAGNTAGVNSRYATLATSPVKNPRAGVLFRLKPDLTGGELLADGYRNTYDFAFNPQGDIFTYDSDEEREISLPWYRPTRVYHSLTGADHGWVSKSWMRRDGYFDMPPAVASFGRGSPTGVACYRHTQFPEKYRGALFVLDWTYGRVHALPLKPAGDTWSSEPELFMSATGQNGFAPTDVEVGPDGSLYVSVGGRGTRGAVYRIRHRDSANAGSEPKTLEAVTGEDRLNEVLTARQPLSSWSRASWKPLALELGPVAFKNALLDESQAPANRVRAIEVLVEMFQGIDTATLNAVAKSSSEEVRARAIWGYGRTTAAPLDATAFAPFLDDPSPLVGRCALEACMSLNPNGFDWSKLVGGLAKRLGGPDRFNRSLAASIVTRMDERLLSTMSAEATKVGTRAVISYAFGWLGRFNDSTQRVRSVIPSIAVAVLKKRDNPLELKRDAVRLLQISLGDMGPGAEKATAFDGYSSKIALEQFERELDPLRVQLAEVFPTGDTELDLEMTRLFAMLTTYSAKVIDAVCGRLTEESDPIDDIHQLVSLARCPMTHSVSQRDKIVRALVLLEEKIRTRKLAQDASWADRVKETWVKLALADQFLAPSIVGHPKFGWPGHTIFLNQMPPELLTVARAAFVKAIAETPDYGWTNDVVFALGDSEDPAHRNLLREQFERFPVRGAVLVVLSRKPEAIDRSKFVAGLEWSQTEVQSACLTALEKLGPSSEPAEQVALVKSLRRLGADASEYAAREKVVALLERNNKTVFPFEKGKAGYRPQPETVKNWTKWVETHFPNEPGLNTGTNEAELADLKRLLVETNWDQGDVARGSELFTRRSCRQCHGGRTALGPDLAGAAGRFSREDLFLAILLPSRDVSARYQTTVVSTHDGKTYTGLIVYESVDGFLLRNATGQTFRIETPQVEERRKSPVSLMPTGLLKGLTSQEIADLYAYLKSISEIRTSDNIKTSAE